VRTLSGAARVFECDLVAMSDGWSQAFQSSTGTQRVTPKSPRLADCLAAGVAAGLAVAAKVGFPDALVDPPDTDEDGLSSGSTPWPFGAPLRGLASRNRMHGPAFVDYASDSIAQVATYPTTVSPNDGAELVTFAAAEQPAAALVPPPAAPYRRITTSDVFGPTGTTKRFSRDGLISGPVGVHATLRAGRAVAQLVAKPNQSAALATRIAERIGITPPAPGRRLVAGHLSFLATQPGAWLASADDEDGALFAQQLAVDLGTFADIIDLTSDVTVVDVVGPHCRDLLSLGLELDTDPSVFPAGHCASAALGHMLTTIGCVDSGTAFQIVINSRDLPDFANWLLASGPEFGLETTA
jgi:methylglutamate dehydrogenase subunit D